MGRAEPARATPEHLALAPVNGLGGATRRPTPPFTAGHERLREEIRDFVRTRLYPHAEAWETAGWFPSQAFGWLAEAGYLGLGFPSRYGGGDDPVAAAVLVEELARCGSGGVAAGLGAHAGIALPPILTFGTEEQRRRYLVPGLAGEKLAALAITEPGAGSDVAAINTYARAVDGGYLVNGAKTYITGGVRADVLVTAVKTRPQGGHHGISFLIVERGPGVSCTPLRKLGWHASDTAEIALDDVFVPVENLLGSEHGGFALIMANFQWAAAHGPRRPRGDAGLLRAHPGLRQALRRSPRAVSPPPARRDRRGDRSRTGGHLLGPAPPRGRTAGCP